MSCYNNYNSSKPFPFPFGVKSINYIDNEEIYSREYRRCVKDDGYTLTLRYKSKERVDLYFKTLEELKEALDITRRNPHSYIILANTDDNTAQSDLVTVNMNTVELAEKFLR